jgi:hypothetical protein
VSLLWVDTNVARSADDLYELSQLAQSKRVTVVVHPQVYLERRRQMQVDCARKNKRFNPEVFDSFLEEAGIQVFEMHVVRATAAEWADRLFARYPTHEDWEAAKKATLGGELRKEFVVLPGRMPMTTDWFVALQIEVDPQSFVITDDQKEEWRILRRTFPKRAFSWNEAIEWLKGLSASA